MIEAMSIAERILGAGGATEISNFRFGISEKGEERGI
jgi:hypothetical protein